MTPGGSAESPFAIDFDDVNNVVDLSGSGSGSRSGSRAAGGTAGVGLMTLKQACEDKNTGGWTTLKKLGLLEAACTESGGLKALVDEAHHQGG